MSKEKLKFKSLELKDSYNIGRSGSLKSILKRPSTKSRNKREKDNLDKGNSNKNEKVFLKDKEPLKSSSKDSRRSNIRSKNLPTFGKELMKDNGKEKMEKVAYKFGCLVMKQVKRILIRDDAKSSLKVLSKEGKVLMKDTRKVNEKEHGKSIGKVLSKVNRKDSGGVRDLIKVKDEEMDHERKKEKGKSHVVKNILMKTPVKHRSVTKIILKSTDARASSSLGMSLKKKAMQTKSTTILKTVRELKKEKKSYFLLGQKHDPPEDTDPLRIFYSTLRDQMPESNMAEVWLMEYGLLPQEEAKKALECKQRQGQSLKHSTLKRTPSTPLQLSDGYPGIKKSTIIFNGRGKDVETSLKGKKKRNNSESYSDYDFLRKTWTKKKSKA